MTKVLLTGSAGFVGSHIAEWFIRTTDWQIVGLDGLTYAGRLDRLAHLPTNRIRCLFHDFKYPLRGPLLREIGDVDYIIHNGAETHVPRSVVGSDIFVRSNVIGTFNVLEAARKLSPLKIIYVSTDEVFGPAREAAFKEDDPLAPSNPYSATKAGGEYLARAYRAAYGTPVIISRTMNMFGERQHPEKFVPLALRKLLREETIDIHCDREGNPGGRQWLHASVQASALLFMLLSGYPGETYHVAGEYQTNDGIVHILSHLVGKQPFVRKVNAFDIYPGHDINYAIDGSKLRAMGWTPPIDMYAALVRFEHWTRDHGQWLEP